MKCFHQNVVDEAVAMYVGWIQSCLLIVVVSASVGTGLYGLTRSGSG